MAPRRRVVGGVALVGRLACVLVALVLLVAATLLPIAGGAVYAVREVDRRLSSPVGGPLRIPPLPQRSTIYAADGSILQHAFLRYNRSVVPLRHIDPITRSAVLAIEDHAFYEHGPVDLRAIVRAFLANLRAGAIVQGGSTITQQLVKNTVTGAAPTVERKLAELRAAIRLERTYTKDEILKMYLNQVYLGHGVYGLDSAARYYFGKPARGLTLAESAVLAGMIANPGDHDPIARPKAAVARREVVLDRMLDLGWIDERRFEHATSAPIRLSDHRRSTAASGPTSFWTQFVIGSFLRDPRFGETYRQRRKLLFQGGLSVYTTLDPRLQRLAERTIRARMTGPGLPQSAVVSIAPATGAIRVMALGNWPFGERRYNLATAPGTGRTAGSAFKVFTLAAALASGIPPTKVYDGSSPKTVPGCGGGETWTLGNAEPGSGSYPLWLATTFSVNTVFAQVIDEVGPRAVARTAHRMGIESPLTPVCPLTLGTSAVSPLEMTAGFATLANDGVLCKPFAIRKVVDASGRVLARAEPACERAIPVEVAREETAILRTAVEFGTGTAANIGRPVAGKTGTGQEYQDAWFLGYIPQLATGVWVGHAEAEIPMPYVPGYGRGFGGVLAAPIWHDFMLAATAGMPVMEFPPPPIPLYRPTPEPEPTPSPSPGTSEEPSPEPSQGDDQAEGNGA